MSFQIPNFTLGQLAQITNGELSGDANLTLQGISPDPLKATPDQLCLVFGSKFIKLLHEGKLNAGAYLVPSDAKITANVPRVAVKRPKLIIKQLLEVFGPKRFSFPIGVHPSAVIDPTASLGKNVKIGPLVYVGPGAQIGDNTELQTGATLGANVKVGSGCLIKSRVVVEDACIIGNRVILHPGAVIGADGFSYVTEDVSNLEKIQAGAKPNDLEPKPQLQLKVPSAGWVEIADDVEIGANTCIDRGTIGATIIGRGTKIDNLVQVAHNCKIGEDCLLIGQSGMAGSVTMGDRVVIAGHSGCKDNTEIGHDSIIAAASHTHKDVEPFSIMGGDPAVTAKEYIGREKSLRRALREVPKLRQELNELKKSIQTI
jgi:UDP-3-O-[3-hydroxymyristoyl] glucosamine N-acyltransferase